MKHSQPYELAVEPAVATTVPARLDRLPFGIVGDLQLLFEVFHHPLLELRRVEIPTALAALAALTAAVVVVVVLRQRIAGSHTHPDGYADR